MLLSSHEPLCQSPGQTDPVGCDLRNSATLNAIGGDIGPDRLEKPPAPGKWSARDIVSHLADAEVAFAFRLRQTLAEDHHVIQPFDQDRWAKAMPRATPNWRAACIVGLAGLERRADPLRPAGRSFEASHASRARNHDVSDHR